MRSLANNAFSDPLIVCYCPIEARTKEENKERIKFKINESSATELISCTLSASAKYPTRSISFTETVNKKEDAREAYRTKRGDLSSHGKADYP